MKKSSKNTIFLIIFILILILGISLIFVFGFNYGGWNIPTFGGNTNNNTNYVPPLDDGTDRKVEYHDQNEKIEARFTYQDLNEANNSPITPSKTNLGEEVNILVVPVEFSDSEFSYQRRLINFGEKELNTIEASFNGEINENTYRESVASYYDKTSYGNLNLNFEITDVYHPLMKASAFLNKEGDDSIEGSTDLITEMLTRGLTIDNEPVDLLDDHYDLNNDDFIDGMWIIYNCKDEKFVNNGLGTTHFWAYTTNYIGSKSLSNYNFRYANCALSFLYDDDSNGQDAHTLIHETGHMLGLDDYYSYDYDAQFGYMGGVDMMDANIGDHSAFSKFSLGWIEPTVMYQNETNITLKPFQKSGEALIIPSSYFNDSAFSEYLILEYQTPTGLNELDANTRYHNKNYPLAYSYGLAIYHVDARLALHEVELDTGMASIDRYLDETSQNIPEIKQNSLNSAEAYMVANSNTNSFNPDYGDDYEFALVKLVSKQRLIYRPGTGIGEEAKTKADLYQKFDSFGEEQLNIYFPDGCFNNGTPISSLRIEVNEMNENSINLTINR